MYQHKSWIWVCSSQYIIKVHLVTVQIYRCQGTVSSQIVMCRLMVTEVDSWISWSPRKHTIMSNVVSKVLIDWSNYNVDSQQINQMKMYHDHIRWPAVIMTSSICKEHRLTFRKQVLWDFKIGQPGKPTFKHINCDAI